jgi:hypothetical protein
VVQAKGPAMIPNPILAAIFPAIDTSAMAIM